MANTTKENYAFISYNHKDVKWAKWLHKRLEWYRLPSEIHNEYSDSKYIRPVFRDRDTLTSGVLNDMLRKNLEASKYLVVICSPNSAQSAWVSDEVKAFIEMGRLEDIIPFIVDGHPQDYRDADIRQPLMGECYPLALRQWNKEHPEKNLLGIAVTDDGKTDKQRAFIRLVASMLGLEFDALWHRHKRMVRRWITMLSVLAVVALALVYWFMIPVRMSITINDEKSSLPGMEKGTLTVNGSDYPLSSPDTTIEIGALPGYFRLREIPVSFHANRFYTDEVMALRVSSGLLQHETLQLHRDSTFAVFAGKVYDGRAGDDFQQHPLKGAVIKIGEHQATADENGYFRIVLTLDQQSVTKPIEVSYEGRTSFQREDESPSTELIYSLR